MEHRAEEEWAALKRIVALLLSLADLAEIAGRRSGPVGGFVLWLLARAETVAQNLVYDPNPAPILINPVCTQQAYATELALRFRVLASQLVQDALLELAAYGELAVSTTGQWFGAIRKPEIGSVLHALVAAMSIRLALGPPVAPDTS